MLLTVSLFVNIVTLLWTNDKMKNTKDFLNWGREVIRKEASAISTLENNINEEFNEACELLFACEGRIVVIGVGKSGHIGHKIAATLASTGSPAFFVHAAEASHGDFGMITRNDVVLAISNSGKTNEILVLLPLIKHLNIPLVSLTGAPNSPLAQGATVNLDIHVPEEAGPLDLAPTCSTTACLVMGDALAIALLQARGFKKEDFARSHPGGTLGKRLLLRVNQLMHTGNKTPKISRDTVLKEALYEMTSKHLGMTTVVDEQNVLLGVFTDGDLRRALEQKTDIETTPIYQLMTTQCCTTTTDTLAYEVFNEMERFKITSMPVIDAEQHVVGVVHLHDILQSGVI
jgi:arabinose-5-phosphate isomerase